MIDIKIQDTWHSIPDEVAHMLNDYARYSKDLRNTLYNITLAAHAHRDAVTSFLKHSGYDERKAVLITAAKLDNAMDVKIVNQENKAA